MILWTHRICVGETIRSKEPPWVSCPDISYGDIPWNRRGKGLGAWPLCLKIILGHILLGFILKIDATKAQQKSIFGCPHMINGTDLRRSPPLSYISSWADQFNGETVLLRLGWYFTITMAMIDCDYNMSITGPQTAEVIVPFAHSTLRISIPKKHHLRS